MKIGIVGTSKLTEEEKEKALILIETLIERARQNDDIIVTGDAEGIDECTRKMAKYIGVQLKVHIAKQKEWNKPDGFKQRNIAIATDSDYIYSISTLVKKERCHHCDIPNHERTGGCWTLRYAIDKLHKKGELIIIK